MGATFQLTVAGLFGVLLLGLSVLIVNPTRPTNRSFFLLTFVASAWSACLILGMYAQRPQDALWPVRLSWVTGGMIPTAFSLLRTAMIYHRETWGRHFARNWLWLAGAAIVAVIAVSPLLLTEVRFLAGAAPGAPPLRVPIYAFNGYLSKAAMIYLCVALLLLLFLLIRDQFSPNITGVNRAELQFLLMGYLVVVLSIFGGIAATAFSHNTQLNRYAPLRTVLFTVIIAYGITSRGILNVRSVLRLGMSYLLLGGYASVIFYVAWLLFGVILRSFGAPSEYWQALCSAVAAALAVTAAGTPLQRITKKILPAADVDFEKTVGQVADIVRSVATLPELLSRFSVVLCRAVGVRTARVLLSGPVSFSEHVEDPADDCLRLRRDDIVLQALEHSPEGLAVEDLHRLASTPERDALLVRMETLESDLILPIRHHEELTGLLMLGARVSGRIYGTTGRATLQLISEQLGIAIVNSQLYTEARQSQAYNQFLVEHLPCGVIATDLHGTLTVVNPEARLLLQLDESSMPSELKLPPEIGRLIPPTLVSNTVAHAEEIILRPSARDRAHLQVSCLPFASERDDLLGAVLVINDHTAIERLQNQVRQSDRLASIGTLASGMAHEIKNPLMALKTFTQLLPKRYNDAEFRSDFSSLVGSEIARIERIVNELLAFARPAPLMIESVNMHEIVDGAVRLVGPQASRVNVTVRKALLATRDKIDADKDRLQQVLLNLLLNALQASEGGGSIELSTEVQNGALHPHPQIRVDVRDTGSGISKESLPHIFDPFFTTKSEGTGLGLSVSYNIIAEHGGRMEVQSEVGKGTCFSIYLPLTLPSTREGDVPAAYPTLAPVPAGASARLTAAEHFS